MMVPAGGRPRRCSPATRPQTELGSFSMIPRRRCAASLSQTSAMSSSCFLNRGFVASAAICRHSAAWRSYSKTSFMAVPQYTQQIRLSRRRRGCIFPNLGDALSNPAIRPHQRTDGSWRAEITWPSVPTSHVGSFKTETEVEHWIASKSEEYFQKTMSEQRRFPPPWSVEEFTEAFVVRDVNGQDLGYFYFEAEPQRQRSMSGYRRTRPGGSQPTWRSCRSSCGRV
jgi:hypothetical protein